MCAGPACAIGEARDRRSRAGARPPSPAARASRLLPGGPAQRRRERGDDRRGASHRVHAVAVRDGASCSAGDPGSSRSCARRRSRSRRCRSRGPATTSATASSRSPAPRTSPRPSSSTRCGGCSRRRGRREDDLECGRRAARASTTTARASTPGCSPPAARTAGRSAGYRLPEHPLQQGCLRRGRGGGRGRPATIPTAVDGCGVVTYALPLERMALAFARLARSTAARRRGGDARAPGAGRRAGAADTRLMRRAPGWIAKGGAEGLMCAPVARRQRLRAQGRGRRQPRGRPALAAFLARLGIELPRPSGDRSEQPRRGGRRDRPASDENSPKSRESITVAGV